MYTYHVDGTLPENGEVFVFGSNLAGIHGAGAAKVAAAKFEMPYGIGKGWVHPFKAYAIPTKDIKVDTIPLQEIAMYVEEFVKLTNDPFILNNGWFVTRVGCGLAGYSDSQIAPMFKGARNCSFAETWKPYLENENGV